MKKILFTLSVCMLPTWLLAWGDTGHRTVGAIAEKFLTPSAKAKLEKLTSELELKDRSEVVPRRSLARLAIWPDEVRSNPAYYFLNNWHFVEIPLGTEYDGERTRKEVEERRAQKQSAGNILLALEDLANFLKDEATEHQRFTFFHPYLKKDFTTELNKKEALALFLHFAGDIHQPLHVGNGADQGANLCFVRYFDKPTDLHHAWDEELVRSTELGFTELAAHLTDMNLEDPAIKAKIADWQKASYPEWAEESKAIRESVYPFSVGLRSDKEVQAPTERCYCQRKKEESERGPKEAGDCRREYKEVVPMEERPILSYEYRYKFIPVMEERILKAGVRAAAVLNRIYGEP